jgi:hypothetical protein
VTSPFLVSTEISDPLIDESDRIEDLILVVITLSSIAIPALAAGPVPDVPELPDVPEVSDAFEEPDEVPVSDAPDARDAVVVSVALLPEDACPSVGWRRLHPPARRAEINTVASTALEVVEFVIICVHPFHGKGAGLPEPLTGPGMSRSGNGGNLRQRVRCRVFMSLRVYFVVPLEEELELGVEELELGVEELVPPVVPLVEPVPVAEPEVEPDGLVAELLEPGVVVELPVPDAPDASEPEVPADVPPAVPVPLVAAEPLVPGAP